MGAWLLCIHSAIFPCSYTSFGTMADTFPNPSLRTVGPSDSTADSSSDSLSRGSYLPAYMLEDGNLERVGRKQRICEE